MNGLGTWQTGYIGTAHYFDKFLKKKVSNDFIM